MRRNKHSKIPRHIFRSIGMLLLFCASAYPVSAVPSLVPLVPLIGIVIVKIALFLGALFFFLLSLVRKHLWLFSAGTMFLLFGLLVFLFL